MMTFHVYCESYNGVVTYADTAKAEDALSAAGQVASKEGVQGTYWAVPAINPPLSVEQVTQLVSFGFLTDLHKSFASCG